MIPAPWPTQIGPSHYRCPTCGRDFIAQDIRWRGYMESHHAERRQNLNRGRAFAHVKRCTGPAPEPEATGKTR